MFAYGGWQNCGTLAAEIREPEKNLARANVIGVIVVIVLYLSLNLAYLRVLTPGGIAASSALASDAAYVAAGPIGSLFVAMLIVISSLGFLAVVILTGPRLYYAMARDGVFFPQAGRLHPRYQTPVFALWFQVDGVARAADEQHLRPAALLRHLRGLALLRVHRRRHLRRAGAGPRDARPCGCRGIPSRPASSCSRPSASSATASSPFPSSRSSARGSCWPRRRRMRSSRRGGRSLHDLSGDTLPDLGEAAAESAREPRAQRPRPVPAGTARADRPRPGDGVAGHVGLRAAAPDDRRPLPRAAGAGVHRARRDQPRQLGRRVGGARRRAGRTRR